LTLMRSNSRLVYTPGTVPYPANASCAWQPRWWTQGDKSDGGRTGDSRRRKFLGRTPKRVTIHAEEDAARRPRRLRIQRQKGHWTLTFWEVSMDALRPDRPAARTKLRLIRSPQRPRNWPETAIREVSASRRVPKQQPWLPIMNNNAGTCAVIPHVGHHFGPGRVTSKPSH
jgi:hypothetical protein